MDSFKKEVIIALIILMAIISIAVGVFFINTFFWSNDSQVSSYGGNSTYKSSNPVLSLSDEEAVDLLNETFVGYLLTAIGAQELHNPPLSGDTPKINLYIDDEEYKAEVVSKRIKVGRGSFTGQDINIKTTKLEVVKMLRDKEHVSLSFSEGNSTIELVAGKLTLFSKGYLGLYEKVTGESAGL